MQATVIATDFHNIQQAYACIVYNINKHKIVSSNILDKFSASVYYTKHIKRLTNYINKNDSEDLEFLMGNVDCNMSVNNGKIYIASAYGIYKVAALTTSFTKVCDVIGTGLTINTAIPVDFKYISDKKFAYAYTVDDCMENILLNVVGKEGL